MSNTHNSTSVRLRVGDGSGLPAIIEGISPEVELTEVEAGVRMDVTTKSGTKSALIPKGEPGENYVLTDDDKEDIAELFSYIRQDAETAAAASQESASAAADSAEAASGSASAAATSAEVASGSASAAAASATAAAGSATAAAGSASSASGSASSASSSSTAAAGFASAAESSAQQASNNAVVARTQANTARTQATNAASSATAAANSATAAADSATAAAGSATAASGSATAAAGSATAAAQSATDAQAAATELEDTIQEVADLETDVSDLNSALASQYPDQNTFIDANVLLYVPYYGYVAKTNWSWQGNYPDTEYEATEGEKFSVMVSDYHSTGNQKIRIQFIDANGNALQSTYPAFDERNRVSRSVIAPANTAKVMLSAWTISDSASPVIGEEYYFKNLLFVEGDIYAKNIKVKSDVIEPNTVGYNILSNNVKPYYIGLRYGVKYPNFDTASKTLTFYAGTCIFDRNGAEISRLEESYVLQCDIGAQQNIIAFDRTSNTYVALLPSIQSMDDRYIVLGMIQIAGSAAWPFGRGWIGIPHTIDGYDPYIKSANPSKDLPSVWAEKVQAIQEAQGTKFTFAIQTDTHYYITEDEYLANNLKVLTNYVGFDFVANLGDVIRGYADTTIDSHENMRKAMTEIMHRYVTDISCPLMVAMGNHDTNVMWADANSEEPFTFAEVWGRMFKPAFNTNPKAITQRGLMYYYTDYDDVRVIVLNTQDGANGSFGIGTEQVSWFTSAALNTNKAVLIMSHVPLVNGWSVNSNYDISYANIVTALQSFKTNGGTVIGCMSGHTHTQENKTVDGILYVTFRNQANLAEVAMVDLNAKTINTITVGFTGNRNFTFT